MSDPTSSFADVMARLRVGDEQAAWEVFQRYARALIARARAQFDERLRHKVDPEDVVQSAYKSFFHRYADGQFQLENWGSLWSLLVVITLRKCANQVKHHQRECRDVDREQAPATSTDSSLPGPVALSNEPTPEEAVILAETLQTLMGQFDEPEQEIVRLSLQGYVVAEIKERTGRAERTVRRVRERFREMLERLRDQQ